MAKKLFKKFARKKSTLRLASDMSEFEKSNRLLEISLRKLGEKNPDIFFYFSN